jgi:tryptophan 7-halogenase
VEVEQKMLAPGAPMRIVIVGGGTAGWLTAAFLSRQLPLTASRRIEITLVEASDIPTVGVGEATIPSLRQTLAACGMGEAEFLKNCDATFKHGIRFQQWRRPLETDPGEAYFHPFGDPLTIGTISPVRQWSRLDPSTRGAFADLFSVQPELALAGRAPKHLRDVDFDGALPYAYHLDAGKFAEFLKRGLRQRTVTQIIAKVVDADQDEAGNINHVTLDSGDRLTADLYIDCTGFSARLINADKTNSFISKSHQLFVDRAVTARIAHSGVEAINGYTNCTAQTAGWIWDIALQGRRGVGHVYSSRHTDDETARSDLAAYLGLAEDEIETRRLDMRIGYHAQQWRGNCVAIGLSSGFLEPLESTGIYLIEMANWALADFIPRFLAGAAPQEKYNAIIANHYENITDFLKLHYCLSERRDSAFWRDNVSEASIPDTLKANLAAWRDAIPSVYDFDRTTQCFSVTNYQFVLFGMGWKGHLQAESADTLTQQLLSELARRREQLKQFVVRDTMPNSEIFAAINAA